MPPIKPGPWTVNPTDIEPRFLDVYHDLTMLLPLWGGLGTDAMTGYDVISRQSFDRPQIGVVGASGPGFKTMDTRGNGMLVPQNIRFDGNPPFAMLAVFENPGGYANDSRIYSQRDLGAVDGQITFSLTAAGEVRLITYNGSIGADTRTTTTFHDGKLHVALVQQNADGTTQIWVDGVLEVEEADAARTLDNALIGLVGNDDRDNGKGWDRGAIMLFASWNDRYFEPSEARLLTVDPFGLIRPAILETEVSGTSFTETVTDVIGVTDSTSRIVDFVRTVTDSVGITDLVLRVVTFVRTVADDVGVTDSVAAPKSIARTATDAVGLTDSTSNVKSIGQTITDAIGIMDAVSRVATFVRTITDALGVTDPVSTSEDEVTYTFTPGTYNQAITGKEEHTLSRDHVSMWRHYGGMIPVGYSVLITSGVATASPGRVSPSVDNIKDADSGSGDDGRAVFTRGSTYTVTSAERTILLAAGYTII